MASASLCPALAWVSLLTPDKQERGYRRIEHVEVRSSHAGLLFFFDAVVTS